MTDSAWLADDDATAEFGRQLVRALPESAAGWLILLQGELGAGKTTLARAMLRELGHVGVVPSPTYTLVEPYELPRGTVYHVDLYRIADASELDFLGWGDLREGLTLVEWPERAADVFAEADLLLSLEYCGDGRTARIQPCSARAAPVAKALARCAETS